MDPRAVSYKIILPFSSYKLVHLVNTAPNYQFLVVLLHSLITLILLRYVKILNFKRSDYGYKNKDTHKIFAFAYDPRK